MNDYFEVINKQREIKQILKQVGWSQRKFAGVYCIDENDYDVEEEYIEKFQQTLKKQLTRTTTKTNILDKYLEFIKNKSDYKKLRSSQRIKEFIPLTGRFKDHSVLVEEASTEYRGILEVATAYALAVGTAWDFHIVPIKSNDHEDRYIVIWSGDIGHSGGSGSWGPAMCEVIKNHWGEYYVDIADHFFEVGLRCITEVVGCFNNQLVLIGRNYDTHDVNNRPSLEYKTYLMKNTNLKWNVIKSEFIG